MTGPDVHGPIDFLIVEFPAGTSGAECANALRDLVDSATIRLYDLMIVAKADDGSVTEVDLASADDGQLGGLREFAGARSGLLGSEDVLEAAGVLNPGTVAAVVLFENAWAVPFVGAAFGEGGQMVATSRLTAQEIMEALDAADAAD